MNEINGGGPVELVRSRLEERGSRIINDRGHEFMAQCPTHDDRNPSLHVSTGDAGQAIFYCHGGCTRTPNDRSRLIEALGLRWSDLYEPNRGAGTGFFRRSASPWYKEQGTRAKGQGQGENVRGGRGTTSAVEIDEMGASGEVERREREVEALLAAHERGEISVTVMPLALPRDASEPEKRVAAFCALVFAVRAWAGMPEEAPMSARWIGGYVHLPHMTVSRALRRLCEYEALERMGAWGRLRTFAYRPWRLAADEVEAAAPAFAGSVEAYDAGRVDEREVVRDHGAVRRAVADDRGEVLERDGRGGAVVADAGGGREVTHVADHNRPSGGRPEDDHHDDWQAASPDEEALYERLRNEEEDN